MTINGINYLLLERRGCEFFKDEDRYTESDIRNYRVCTPSEMIPCKDSKTYFFEFGAYTRYEYKDGKKRLLMQCAMSLDSQYSNERGSWRNLNLEKEFYAEPRKYTEQNILDYVNSVSTEHFDAIMYVDTFEFDIASGENFTPSTKMIEFAKKNHLEHYNSRSGDIRLKLFTGEYSYLMYDIKGLENKPGVSRVTIYLKRETDKNFKIA